MYNKPPRKRASRAKKPKVQAGSVHLTNKERRKKMRRSEKIISSQLSESLKSESMNSSMLANLSIETIISDHEEMELEVQFSKVALKVRKRCSNQTEKDEQNIDRSTHLRKLLDSEQAQVLSGRTLLNIIYCALNICGSKIQLSDLIRFVREGHISYYKCKLLLPEELLEHDVQLSFNQYHNHHNITYESFKTQLTYFTRFIPDLQASIKTPNFFELVARYVKEMQLPGDVNDYVARLLIMFPSEMNFTTKWLPNYESRAMAYIILTLKLLFGLDGYREDEISRSANKINRKIEELGLGKKIFSYKHWMVFIEYRQLVLGKFYHPTLFHHTNSVDKPYALYNSMMNFSQPKTRKLEDQNVSSRRAKHVQSKTNAQEILRCLMQNYSDDCDANYTFPCSLTPLTDNFHHILSHEKKFEINRLITGVDYTKDSCEPFLKPQLVVNSLKTAGFKVVIKKSTFPKSFIFKKSEEAVLKEDYNLSLDEMTEQEWRDDLKKRLDLEEKYSEEEILEYHQKRMKKVLETRKKWRKEIRLKKYMRRNGYTTAANSDTDEPTVFKEPNIFSESDDDSGDDSGDEIVADKKRSTMDDADFTLVVPDFNLWHVSLVTFSSSIINLCFLSCQRGFFINEAAPNIKQDKLEKLPQNFLWLLKFSASILHQSPISLYRQLLIIERRFIKVYKPVELYDNAILLKRPKARKMRRS